MSASDKFRNAYIEILSGSQGTNTPGLQNDSLNEPPRAFTSNPEIGQLKRPKIFELDYESEDFSTDEMNLDAKMQECRKAFIKIVSGFY
jgi:hypothetical protein